ncbi:wax ester/triacylglycerol synthase domain-containing protein [Dactylosporangium sp. CA-139066]|uniref:wax ester/triacylglycerol synthase domain-containing protein n=1 Tax=Dactylosporangium sp. CA-139066 TaxID=3239930 RepID=UPI003D8E23F2
MQRSAGQHPRRVLILSADIGGGHDATGRALQERAERLWPGSVVRWADTLDVMGRWVGPAFRRIYTTNVELTPWLYEFFYAALWRHRWFTRAAKRFVGAWAGRRLAPVLEAFEPDVVLSTYPLGSAGLAWLRARRGLGVPAGAWVSDFAPHPLWVYPELDLTFVAHPAAVPLASVAAPGARVDVCEPPVAGRYHPGDPDAARRSFGLDPRRPVVLVSCGSLGFGAVQEAVRALAEGVPAVTVVAVCGRNERLRQRLSRWPHPPGRLRVLGWVDRMPELLQSADLLITNAGGATALEAVAAGVDIVMYRPIAAHGAANAALMTACGLAETCAGPAQLVSWVRARLNGPAPGAVVRPGGRPDLGLAALLDAAAATAAAAPGPVRRRPSWPMRAQDAFFLYVESASVPQQIGAVIDLGRRPDGRSIGAEDVVRLLAGRLGEFTALRRRPVHRGRWRRPGWVVEPVPDPAAHVQARALAAHGETLPDAAATARADAAVDEFWSGPLPRDGPPWRVLVLTGLPLGQTRLVVAMHHSLADGLSAVRALQRLLTDAAEARAPATTRRAMPAARPGATLPDWLRRGRTVWGGLARLAGSGTAPATAWNRSASSGGRRLLRATVATADLARLARLCRAHPSEVACAVVSEAVRRTWPGESIPARLRAMFAVALDLRARGRRRRS